MMTRQPDIDRGLVEAAAWRFLLKQGRPPTNAELRTEVRNLHGRQGSNQIIAEVVRTVSAHWTELQELAREGAGNHGVELPDELRAASNAYLHLVAGTIQAVRADGHKLAEEVGTTRQRKADQVLSEVRGRLEDAIDRIEEMGAEADALRSKMGEVEAAHAETHQRLDDTRTELTATRTRLEAEREQMRRERDHMESTKQDLERQNTELTALIDRLRETHQEEVAKLRAEIQECIREGRAGEVAAREDWARERTAEREEKRELRTLLDRALEDVRRLREENGSLRMKVATTPKTGRKASSTAKAKR